MTPHVTATGVSAFGRRPESLVEIAAEAAEAALGELGRKPIDLLVVGNMLAGAINDTENLVSRLANRVGLETAAGWRVEAASASGAAAFQAAAVAVAGGPYERALVVAAKR